MNSPELFLKNMFEHFRKITKNGQYDGYKYLHYEKDYSFRFAQFLEKMDYFTYDVKNAIIRMSTKNGEIYAFEDLVKFNKKYSRYLKISGIGNDISAITIDPGCAIIEFELNTEYFKEDIIDIQYAVRLPEIIDTFDVYPIDIIVKRAIKVYEKYEISEIKLVGDYATGNACSESSIDFVVDFSQLNGFGEYTFLSSLENKFKCDVNVFDESEIDKFKIVRVFDV